jgi:hypothetical protein
MQRYGYMLTYISVSLRLSELTFRKYLSSIDKLSTKYLLVSEKGKFWFYIIPYIEENYNYSWLKKKYKVKIFSKII